MYSDPLERGEREREREREERERDWFGEGQRKKKEREERKEEREERARIKKKKKFITAFVTILFQFWNGTVHPCQINFSFKTTHVKGSLVFGVPNAKHSKTPHVRGYLVFGIRHT